MLEWLVETKKHARFFAFSLLLVVLALILHSSLHNSVSGVIWAFSDILVSSAAAAYVAVYLFNYVVLDGDLLLHMSTQAPAKKLFLKTVPLTVGFLLVGLVTITGYSMTSEGSAADVGGHIYLYGAKIASVASFVALAWILARLAAVFRGLSAQIVAYGVFFGVVITAEILACWNAFSLAGSSWSVGAGTEFLGLPLYANVLAIVVGENADWSVSSAMIAALVVNVLTVIVCVLLELVVFRPRGRPLPIDETAIEQTTPT